MDIMKACLVQGAQTIQSVSVRIILVVGKINYFRTWVADVRLAYLQSDKLLVRKIFISNPAAEFELSP